MESNTWMEAPRVRLPSTMGNCTTLEHGGASRALEVGDVEIRPDNLI